MSDFAKFVDTLGTGGANERMNFRKNSNGGKGKAITASESGGSRTTICEQGKEDGYLVWHFVIWKKGKSDFLYEKANKNFVELIWQNATKKRQTSQELQKLPYTSYLENQV